MSLLVGRDREVRLLRDLLTAARSGRGSLTLISGESGIGKTALVEALMQEATGQGGLVLVGRCSDFTETPPYGPWRDLLDATPPVPRISLPAPFSTAAAIGDVTSQGTLFFHIRDLFAALTPPHTEDARPLVLVLEDLHWADPASVALLRFLAPTLRSAPIIIVVTYRSEELSRTHALYQAVPALVRDAQPLRLDLHRLTDADVRTFVRTRYALAAEDESRLTTDMQARSEGNPLFLGELLRTLEEEGVLHRRDGRWMLGDVARARVPLLLHQVIDARLVRLGAEAERLLTIAAIIGQEVPLDLWAGVSDTKEDVLLDLVERAVAARVLEETPEGERVRFAHALIREALYEGILAARRRRLHCQIGAAIATMPDAHPDVVAYHFRMAGDARATEWLVRAGWRAYRSFAYGTAQAHFTEALPRIGGVERVRILLALTALERFSGRGARYAAEALVAARGTGDATLTAIVQFRMGINLGYRGRTREAVAALEEASAVLDALPDDTLPAFALSGLTFVRGQREQYLPFVLAYGGRWREALALLGTRTLGDALDSLDGMDPNRSTAALYVCLFLCRPDGVRRSLDATNAFFAARADFAAMLVVDVAYEHMLFHPFLADDREARNEIDATLAQGIRQAERALGDVPPMLNRCPRLVVEGRWEEARALWVERHEDAATHDAAWSLSAIGAMARARGERDDAWALVREGLPDGPLTEPGTTHFVAMDMQRLAARLALDDGDRTAARTWLEMHDRWLVWAGARGALGPRRRTAVVGGVPPGMGRKRSRRAACRTRPRPRQRTAPIAAAARRASPAR